MKPKGAILVVDDSATSAMMLASILCADGYEVTPAESGEAALRSVKERKPELVLLDLNMAGLSGLEVCRRLKANPSTREIPVMFISAATEAAEKVEAFELGAVDFVAKPVQPGELRARIKTHLELRRLQVESERHRREVERANHLLREELDERRWAEEALAQSLKEKEDLLKEVHHRVKNNLALIVSLTRLESCRLTHPEAKAVLEDMQARISSVALLNEVLYKTGSYSHVHLANYLRQIANHLVQAQASRTGAIRLTMDLGPMSVETRQAIPCGLIVNELLTNSLKYAFPGGRSGEIRISLERDQDTARLRVSDDGQGLPADFATRRTRSLGLQLVSDLARQLGGTLDVRAPAEFTISFPSMESAAASAIPG